MNGRLRRALRTQNCPFAGGRTRMASSSTPPGARYLPRAMGWHDRRSITPRAILMEACCTRSCAITSRRSEPRRRSGTMAVGPEPAPEKPVPVGVAPRREQSRRARAVARSEPPSACPCLRSRGAAQWRRRHRAAFWRRVQSERVHIHAPVLDDDRDRHERVCRDTVRPPVTDERLHIGADGAVELQLRHPWADGTTSLVFEPTAFLERLAVLVPRPRINLVLYHGVLAPRAAATLGHVDWRA